MKVETSPESQPRGGVVSRGQARRLSLVGAEKEAPRYDGVIGYMVPAFPGPTHTFFWREIASLRALGADVALLSTRAPSDGECPHAWAGEARRRTFYALRNHGLRRTAGCAMRIGLRRWGAAFRVILEAEGESLKERARLAVMAIASVPLVDHVMRSGITHLHSQFSYDGANLVLFASILSGVPYSISYHAQFCGVGNQQQKARHARFGIAVTDHMLAYLRKELGDSLPRRMHVRAIGADVENFQRTTTYSPYLGSGPLRVFSCGRLSREKGHADMLETIALLKARGLTVNLRIAGAEPSGQRGFRAYLEGRARELGIEQQVRLLGALDELEVREELECCHVFALASWEESFGVVYAEAMAMEVPAVGTAIGGVPELIDEASGSGVLVPPRDPEAMADALQKLAADPMQCVRLGRAGRRRVFEKFSSDKSAAELIEAICTTG
jgi:colanic acid/amylovoran biosynthesis glycosyltransferase